MPQYHIEEVVPLSELKIFQWNGKGVEATSAHFFTDGEWNYTMLYMYTNMEEVIPHFEKFDKIYWKRSIEAIGSHARAWDQRWPKLHEVIPYTYNLSLTPFSFVIVEFLYRCLY
jgi:hypothetical protein